MVDKSNSDKRRHIAHIVAGVLAVAIFIAMVTIVKNGSAAFIDDPIRYLIYDMRTPWLTAIMKAITYMGNWETITVVCIVLLVVKKTRITYGLPLAIGSLFVSLANKGIKELFLRPRPQEIHFLIEQGGWSFPSGHSITSMFFYGMAIYLVRKNVQNSTTANILTVLLAIPLILIGISRVYLGVHYPTDVLAGWSLGVLAIVIVTAIIEKFAGKNRD